MHPPIEEPVPVGLELRVFDAVVALEGVPEVRAAVAHQLHRGLVFRVVLDEFAPIVDQRHALDEKVVAGRAVVGRLEGPLMKILEKGCPFHSFSFMSFRPSPFFDQANKLISLLYNCPVCCDSSLGSYLLERRY